MQVSLTMQCIDVCRHLLAVGMLKSSLLSSRLVKQMFTLQETVYCNSLNI